MNASEGVADERDSFRKDSAAMAAPQTGHLWRYSPRTA